MMHSMFAVLCAGAAATFAICDVCRTPPVPGQDAAIVSIATASVRDAAVDPKTVTLNVTGMTCGGCAIATRKVLERLEGVKEAEVSYEDQRAVVTYDPDRVTVEQMIAAVKKLGYTATVVAS
ncbi:MAG: metal-binding (seleno)protein [Gemmatimonadaceae bacterium]